MRRPHCGRPRQWSSATRPWRWRPARLPLVAASPAAPRVLGETLPVLPRWPCRRVCSAVASGGHAPAAAASVVPTCSPRCGAIGTHQVNPDLEMELKPQAQPRPYASVRCLGTGVKNLTMLGFSRCHLISFQCYISKQELQFVSMSS